MGARFRTAVVVVVMVPACADPGDASDGSTATGDSADDDAEVGPATNASADETGEPPPPACAPGSTPGELQAPTFVQNVPGETSWYASPLVVDLDGDGARELVAAYYSVFVYDAALQLVAQDGTGDSRVYAPHVVADLDGDGTLEIVAGRGHEVYAYELVDGALVIEDGWPADTTTAGNPPEVRGLAAADLDGDGTIEVVATTTQTADTAKGGAQVFVFAASGASFQPAGIEWTAWPRYNSATGPGNDADRNGEGHHGFGCYGLNVGIGDLDGDPEQEIVVTYDNHHIQVFDPDGVALDAAPWFTNRATDFEGARMTWGQFIRWADPVVEEDHYHLHQGEWPHPSWTEWLQWTAAPPNVVDLDGDGENEVVGVPNVEMHEPYETQAWAVMVLEGNHGGGDRAAMRKPGWEELPRGGSPLLPGGDYPPIGVPAPTTVDLDGDARLEIIAPLGDGSVHAFGPDGVALWSFDHRFGETLSYASEVTVADLDQDGTPELVFATYGAPESTSAGHLVVLRADGELGFEVALPNPGNNGNGNGAPAAPTIADLDGDGTLEIFVQTFDHGMDVFTVPSSADNCVPWSTGRGGPLRTGRAHGHE